MTPELTVIHIMSHPPAYEEYANQPRPKINWDTPDGSWVGIWGYAWSDVLAIECRKADPSIAHEIWQPDLRADKVYSQELFPGVVHRLIPAISKPVQYGFKKKYRLDWSNMVNRLTRKKTQTQSVIRTNNFDLVRLIGESGAAGKIIFSYMGQIRFPAQRIFALSKNFPAKFNLIKEHRVFKKAIDYISAVTYMNDRYLDSFRRHYKGPLYKITMGVDFDRWRKLDKNSCRRKLGLPLQRTLIFTSSRLNGLKQIDRFITVLKRLQDRHDFLFIVSGHGKRKYEAYLESIAGPLLDRNQVLFTGYIGDDQLRRYYCASDLFVLMSLSEGASVAVMKALACGIPVFSTDVGNTAEVMREHGVGRIVPKKDYGIWEKKLDEFLCGDPVPVLPVAVAKKHYHWPNVAKKFNEVYKRLV